MFSLISFLKFAAKTCLLIRKLACDNNNILFIENLGSDITSCTKLRVHCVLQTIPNMSLETAIYTNLEILDPNFILDDCLQQTSINISIPTTMLETSETHVEINTRTFDKVSTNANSKSRRARNPEKWLVNVRKRQRQSGENYVDRKGQTRRARTIGEACGSSCRLQCCKQLGPEDRQRIHQQFWELTDEQKWQFYAVYVERWLKDRPRTQMGEIARKNFTYVYYLQKENMARVRVCKTFFLRTLDISQKRLYFFHEKVRTPSGLPRASLRGKIGGRGTPEEQLYQIRDHIRSFTRLSPPPGLIPDPTEEFLDRKVSIRRMYELYRQMYGRLAVKENVYRKVLKTEFNIKFIKPTAS